MEKVGALLRPYEYFVADDLSDSHRNVPLSGNIVTTGGHHNRQKGEWLLCPHLGKCRLWMNSYEGKMWHQVIAKDVQHQFGFMVAFYEMVEAYARGEQ